LYYNIELPLISVLASMEAEGIRVDTDFLARLSTEMQKRIDEYTLDIYKIAGGKFNINSTQQLSHILFEKLGLPTKGKTAKKTGFSTDVTVLEELANLHEFPRLILKFRQLGKLKSTYIDALPELVNPNTGRVHTTFNQTIAATGRLSSTDPNLQNIPIRTDDGREIRKAFVPRDSDHILLAADYSQIELRILAHYSQDAALIDAFHKGQDIHSRTAAEVFDVPLDQVTSEQRRTAKTCNFAIIYGVTAFGLSQQTGLTRDAAQKFIDKYFERYPGIRGYIDATKKFAVENGYVTTLFNRRRYLPEIADKNFSVRSFAERTAINTPIQGTAADIIKLAMIKIHNDLARLKSRMVLQVHDELVLDVHKPELAQVTEIVRKGMEKAAKLNVPLIADIGSADNWLDAK
jgi:DNA polymerase-1